MTRLARPALALIALTAWCPLQAQDSLLMKAMRDELDRSMAELRLRDLERPYFISYSVRESTIARVEASLGAMISRSQASSRNLSVEVRVGDPGFDNTNFYSRSNFGSSAAFSNSPARLPLEDDYRELRRKIWLATDSAYKRALAQLSKKRAALQNATRVDEVPDFSEADPHEYADDRAVPEPDPARLESLVREVSDVFDGMSHIFVSEVQASESSARVSYVNSEGSSFIRDAPRASVRILAGTQADDGMALEDSLSAHARSLAELPAVDELVGRARGLAASLAEQRDAEYLDRYNGPVLFEGQAAAELVRRVLAPRLVASRLPVADDPRFASSLERLANPFMDKLGARVLPRFLSVVDDPTVGEHEQRPLLGGYAVDDEGVPARATPLVQRGILKTLLATRNPVPGVLISTGNRRSSGPAPSNLLVIPDKGLEPEELRDELLSLVRERELEFGISVRRIGDPQGRVSRGRRGTVILSGSGERSQIDSVWAYKIYPDGREELIRSAALMGIGESDFRDIVAASSASTVHTGTFIGGSIAFTAFSRLALISVVAPSLLFEDVTVRRPSGNIPRPPVVPHPLADQ